MAMITIKKDIEAAKYEKVDTDDLLVINSHFTCRCATGWCFRHGVDKRTPANDASIKKGATPK